MGDDNDLSGLEDAVFRAPPREFTAARDVLVLALKAAGRGNDAKAVKVWRRPTVPVWLWNRLILEGEDVARDAVEKASELADAIAAGSDGRGELTQAIAALRRAGSAVVARAQAIAGALSVGLSPAQERELADLVQALPWSEVAREEAARGRLRALPPPVDPLEAMRVLAGAPPARRDRDAARSDGGAGEEDDADTLRAQLEAEAEATRLALADAEAALAGAERATKETRAELARAEERLEEARRAAADAVARERECARAVDEAKERRDAAEAARVS